jgi:cytochrome P450
LVLTPAPTLLLVSDATQLPIIYNRNANKTAHYVTGSFGETESLFNMREHRIHARYRKIAAGPYSFSNIKKMEPLVDQNIRRWIEKLDVLFVWREEGFDFSDWATYVTFRLRNPNEAMRATE